MSRAAIAVLLLLACSAPPTATEPPPAVWPLAVDQLERWEKAFGAAPACWDELQTGLVTFGFADSRTVLERCDGVIETVACTRMRQDGGAFMLLPLAPWEGIVRHEITHWLEACGGRDELGDPDHDDAPAWALAAAERE